MRDKNCSGFTFLSVLPVGKLLTRSTRCTYSCTAHVFTLFRFVGRFQVFSPTLFPISDCKQCKTVPRNLRCSYSHCQSRVPCAPFKNLLPLGLAALLRSACFFAGALFFARMTVSRSAFHSFRLDSSSAKECIEGFDSSVLCRSRRELSHE